MKRKFKEMIVAADLAATVVQTVNVDQIANAQLKNRRVATVVHHANVVLPVNAPQTTNAQNPVNVQRIWRLRAGKHMGAKLKLIARKPQKKVWWKIWKLSEEKPKGRERQGCPRQKARRDNQFLKQSQPAEDAEVIISQISNPIFF